MTDLTFLPMLYIWTNDSILSYVKMLSNVQDWIPNICGQHKNIEYLGLIIVRSIYIQQLEQGCYLPSPMRMRKLKRGVACVR